MDWQGGGGGGGVGWAGLDHQLPLPGKKEKVVVSLGIFSKYDGGFLLICCSFACA